MPLTAMRLEVPLLEAEAKLWLTAEREKGGELVLEFLPPNWTGEMPGFRLRWRLSTAGVLYVQKHLREAVLPLTRVQENVIANFQPGEDVAVTVFVNERDCNEVINALGTMASYIARERDKLYY